MTKIDYPVTAEGVASAFHDALESGSKAEAAERWLIDTAREETGRKFVAEQMLFQAKVMHAELMCLKYKIWEVHKLLHRDNP